MACTHPSLHVQDIGATGGPRLRPIASEHDSLLAVVDAVEGEVHTGRGTLTHHLRGTPCACMEGGQNSCLVCALLGTQCEAVFGAK